MNVTKMLATGGAALILAVGIAAPASAETLYRSGATKVTVLPQGAPDGAAITRAKVTVKKGKKTVARNKNSYRAKKGTYKVTSTVSYLPQRPVQMQAGDVWAECRVTSREVISDRTTADFYWLEYGYVDISGQVTYRYTGTCTDDPIDVDYRTGSWVPNVTWNTTWTSDEYVWADWYSGVDYGQFLTEQADYKVGDVDYVSGNDMSSLPSYVTYDPQVTTKSTRTVVVR